MRECKIIAHRGASTDAPQNTLPAFKLALAAHTDGFETDVHLTADGVPVLCHDHTIDATSDGTGFIDSLPLASLRSFDFGSWKAPAYAGTRIPTLDEFLTLCETPALTILNIELKNPRQRRSDIVKKTIDAVAAHGLSDKLLISSFSPRLLRQVKAYAPACRTAFLFPTTQLRTCLPLLSPFRLVKYCGLSAIHPYAKIVDARMVNTAHRLGLDVNVWTVDDETEIRRLVCLGVDGLITNDPVHARRVMESCYAYLR